VKFYKQVWVTGRGTRKTKIPLLILLYTILLVSELVTAIFSSDQTYLNNRSLHVCHADFWSNRFPDTFSECVYKVFFAMQPHSSETSFVRCICDSASHNKPSLPPVRRNASSVFRGCASSDFEGYEQEDL